MESQEKKRQPGKQVQMVKVLLAEDDVTMVSLLKTLLSMEGYDVVALDADSDVAAAVQREKPDALFMDVHLGDQSGMEILENIRKNGETANIRVIMTSGMNMKEECIQSGANAFLLKPFMPDDLLRALK
jgi:CheY-like chemotaxis protein